MCLYHDIDYSQFSFAANRALKSWHTQEHFLRMFLAILFVPGDYFDTANGYVFAEHAVPLPENIKTQVSIFRPASET